MLNESTFGATQGGIITGTRVIIELAPGITGDALVDLVSMQTHATPQRALQSLVYAAVRLGLPVRIVDDAHDLLPDYLLNTSCDCDPWADEPTIEMGPVAQ